MQVGIAGRREKIVDALELAVSISQLLYRYEKASGGPNYLTTDTRRDVQDQAMLSILKWTSGIVAAVIAGVAVWYLTQPPPTPPPQTFLEKLSGTYTLRDWIEANRPVNMGVRVDRGELRIDTSGDANWELAIWDSALHPQGPPPENRSRIKCGGSVNRTVEELRWVSGGQRNIAVDCVRGIESVRDMVWLAYCGGNVQASAPFKLHFEQPSSGQATLEMTNSEGRFVWAKN